MSAAELSLLVGAAAAHCTLWLLAVNLLHATALQRTLMHVLTAASYLWLLCGPLAFLLALCAWPRIWGTEFSLRPADWPPWLTAYAATCGGLVAWPTFAAWRRRLFPRPADRCLSERTLDLRRWSPAAPAKAAAQSPPLPRSANWLHRGLLRWPYNDVCTLAVTEKELLVERLPPELDGFAIAHLSDLHFTGRVPWEFFVAVAEQVQTLAADWIAVTGDLVDEADCLSWLKPFFTRLHAEHGVHYVLGNHDQLVPQEALQAALDQTPGMNLTGRAVQLTLRGQRVVVAGDALPWYRPGPRPPAGGALRVLLAHSPDRLAWARREQFDLMLAGHNHGGQICLPWWGPVVAPSLHHTRHSGGVYYSAPTLLHVSRGVSSELPLRVLCPPEITRLVLRSGQRSE